MFLNSFYVICFHVPGLLPLKSYFVCIINAVIVVSKTFTTAETMLNARTLREWISTALGLVQQYDSAL